MNLPATKHVLINAHFSLKINVKVIDSNRYSWYEKYVVESNSVIRNGDTQGV